MSLEVVRGQPPIKIRDCVYEAPRKFFAYARSDGSGYVAVPELWEATAAPKHDVDVVEYRAVKIHRYQYSPKVTTEDITPEDS